MCGRVVVSSSVDVLAAHFDAAETAGLRDTYELSHNLAPARALIGLVRDANGDRMLGSYRWGLVPHWADDASVGNRMFNARAETVSTSRAFSDALGTRRLAVLVDGFFEWGPAGGGGAARRRWPFFFHRSDGGPLAFAGLWETWRPASHRAAAPLRTCTVITTSAGADLDGIHDRMPVVLEPDVLDAWLDRRPLDTASLHEILRPSEAGTLGHHRVDPSVGNVRNDSADLVAPWNPEDHPSAGPEPLRLFG
ncbi:MAG TPA: SOS response-associated peptidase [Acidimicrobiales bacterium]|jgi:putative SOS response-associated peptidase YedK